MTMKSTSRTSSRGLFRLSRSALAIGLSTTLLAGCANMLPRNSTKNLSKVDQTTLPRVAEQIAAESAMLSATQDKLMAQIERVREARPLPAVQPVYDPLENEVVSLHMFDANVGNLLWAMSDQLKMNLVMDPKVQAIEQRATLNLTNVTASEVFEHILNAFDLHGEVKGKTLYVSLMNEKVFDLDFLNTRMNVDISSGGNVFGQSQGGGGGGSSSGGASGGGGGSNALRSDFSLSGGMAEQTGVYEQLDKSLKSILGDQGQAKTKNERKDTDKPETVYALNSTTGTLFVRARPSEMKSIEKMINRYRSVIGRQVQIDAQLIDVLLDDGFEFGVDWNILRDNLAGVIGDAAIALGSAAGTLPGLGGLPPRSVTIPGQTIGNNTGRAIGVGYATDTFSVAVNMLRGFGNVKVLSNPTIRTRNGSPAMLSVGTNIRYISNTTTTVSNPGGGATTTSSNAETDALFSGIVVGVVPFIREDGTVELLVHPMQSDVDPNSLQLVDAGGGSRVTLPITNFKGMTTTLNIKDGDTVLIGGLIDQQVGTTHSGVPGLSDIPLLGKLFDKSSDSHRSRELVMIIRVKVL